MSQKKNSTTDILQPVLELPREKDIVCLGPREPPAKGAQIRFRFPNDDNNNNDARKKRISDSQQEVAILEYTASHVQNSADPLQRSAGLSGSKEFQKLAHPESLSDFDNRNHFFARVHARGKNDLTKVKFQGKTMPRFHTKVVELPAEDKLSWAGDVHIFELCARLSFLKLIHDNIPNAGLKSYDGAPLRYVATIKLSKKISFSVLSRALSSKPALLNFVSKTLPQAEPKLMAAQKQAGRFCTPIHAAMAQEIWNYIQGAGNMMKEALRTVFRTAIGPLSDSDWATATGKRCELSMFRYAVGSNSESSFMCRLMPFLFETMGLADNLSNARYLVPKKKLREIDQKCETLLMLLGDIHGRTKAVLNSAAVTGSDAKERFVFIAFPFIWRAFQERHTDVFPAEGRRFYQIIAIPPLQRFIDLTKLKQVAQAGGYSAAALKATTRLRARFEWSRPVSPEPHFATAHVSTNGLVTRQIYHVPDETLVNTTWKEYWQIPNTEPTFRESMAFAKTLAPHLIRNKKIGGVLLSNIERKLEFFHALDEVDFLWEYFLSHGKQLARFLYG